jgi:hypothetical protein
MFKKTLKILGGVLLGLPLGLVITYSTFAKADTAAILDTVRRGYFVATGTSTMTIGTSGTGQFAIVAAGTPVAYVDSASGISAASGYGVKLAAYVPTAVATPVAGTNIIKPGLNVVPTNAANNALFIGAATPVPGQHFVVNNAAGAAIRLKAAGGATLNGATAGGYISVASLATVECFTASATNQVCLQPVVPTPAGP